MNWEFDMTKRRSHGKKSSRFSNIHYALALLWQGHKSYVLFQLIYAAFSAVRCILPVLIIQKIIQLLNDEASIGTFLLWMAGMIGGLFVVYMIHI